MVSCRRGGCQRRAGRDQSCENLSSSRSPGDGESQPQTTALDADNSAIRLECDLGMSAIVDQSQENNQWPPLEPSHVGPGCSSC